MSAATRGSQVPASPSAAQVETYRATVERVFMRDRGGTVPGVAACVMYTHNGPRRWQSRDDPEFQTLAVLVRGERKGPNCS